MNISKELVNKVLGSDFKSDELDNYYVIMIGDKLFAPPGSRMFHQFADSAWKHFYNEYNWRIKNRYKVAKYGERWWDVRKTITETDTQIWNAFKSELYKNYNFRIIQWKDAKRELCKSERDGEPSEALL